MLIFTAAWHAMLAAMRRRRASAFSVWRQAVVHREHIFEHLLQLPTFQADRRGFDRERSRPEGLGLEAVALQLLGDAGKRDHLRRQKVDQQRHQQPLPLDLLRVALAQDLLKQHPLMRNVLIDDPEALVVHRQDERIAQLAQRLQRGERIEGRFFDDATAGPA